MCLCFSFYVSVECFPVPFSASCYQGSPVLAWNRKESHWSEKECNKQRRRGPWWYIATYHSATRFAIVYLLTVSFVTSCYHIGSLRNTPCFCIWSVALRTSVQDFRLVSFFAPEFFGHPLLLLLSAQVIVLLQSFVWSSQLPSFLRLFMYPLVSCQFFPGADMSQFIWPNCVDSSIISSLDVTLYARNVLKTKRTSKCFKMSKQVSCCNKPSS